MGEKLSRDRLWTVSSYASSHDPYFTLPASIEGGSRIHSIFALDLYYWPSVRYLFTCHPMTA